MSAAMFKDKTLLITGGTGSFGNAVLSRMLAADLREIRIFSRDEKKQDDMRKRYASDKLKFYIGDVRDYPAVLSATRGDHAFANRGGGLSGGAIDDGRDGDRGNVDDQVDAVA